MNNVVEFKDKRAVNEDHELYTTWKQVIKAHSAKSMVCDRWLYFWNFVEDVGKHPGKHLKFFRISKAQPYAPDNFQWLQRYCNTPEFRKDKAEWARYYRAKKLQEDPTFHKDKDLQRNFGIGIKEYNKMLESQNGVCAICEGTEKSTASSGSGRPLAVDHCHVTGKIRGLLCSRCNRGIGFLGDSVTSLKRAISYLGGNVK